MSAPIALIAGLGNPGQQYQDNRHNAGAIFLSGLCRQGKTELKADKKFQGMTGTVRIGGNEVRLLFPTTYMNHSGRAVAALASYYRIPPEQILIAYDELDLPLGTTRLKFGGGHGGHNGIRDIIANLGTPEFLRLRIGIGHPGSADKVLGHVLGDFTRTEASVLDQQTDKALAILPLLVEGKNEIAMQQLHTK